MVHHTDRLAPVVRSIGSCEWLLAVGDRPLRNKEWLALITFRCGLSFDPKNGGSGRSSDRWPGHSTYKSFDHDTNGGIKSYSEHIVTAAIVLGLHIILVGNSRILSDEVMHGCLGDDIATSSVAEGHGPDQGHDAEVFLLGRVELTQRVGEVRPGNIRVGIDEDVPVVVGSQAVGLLGHVDVLVLVQVPSGTVGAFDALDAVVLVNGALLLQAVEVEVVVVFLGLVEHRLEAVTDVEATDVLVEIGEEEVVGETLQCSHYLHRQFVIGLGGTGFHNEQNPRCVWEARTDGVLSGLGGL